MTGWLRLESRCAQWGWTGNLPATQFAAWVKLLCTVKVVGDRHGRVREDYFCDRILRTIRIPRTAWESMLAEAQKGGEQAAVQKNGPYLQIVAWRTYQPDPTALKRQSKHRKGVATGCHGDTALDTVSHDDVDVDADGDNDKTRRDKTKDERKKTLSAKPTPDPRIKILIDKFFDAYKKVHGRAYLVAGAKDGKLFKQMLAALDAEKVADPVAEIVEAMETMLADPWGKPNASIGLLSSQINRWRGGPQEAARPGSKPSSSVGLPLYKGGVKQSEGAK